jgi:hypothetical protein
LKHIHVTSYVKVNPDNYPLEETIFDQVDSCLYSLICGLRQKAFGLDTINNFAFDLKKYNESFLDGIATYADSGGYSIIKGDVEPKDIERFIECYTTFFEYENDLYDKIFSLDIPFSLKHEELNKKDLIYEYNKCAMTQQLEVIARKPYLLDKLYFVWHFKMKSLYDIWSRLVSDLGLNNIIRNRAIGGMVSLRNMTEFNSTPFTGIAFRCFHDYLKAGYFDNGFRLHFLGINLPYDRFHIAFLEKLFRRLSEGQPIYHTYDSINYVQGARMRKDFPVYEFTDDNELIVYDSVSQVPQDLMKKIYRDNLVRDYIYDEIERRKSGKRLESTNSFIALNIYSNLCLDRFFEYLIDKYEMVDKLLNANSTAVVEGKFKLINSELKKAHPTLFRKEMMINLIENMEYTWTYCDWFKNDRSDVSLDYYINRLIECIGFNDILT